MPLNNLLMNFANYRVVVKTCLHIFPLILDFVSIFFVVILVFAVLGVYLFGGKIHSGFPREFENLTGESLAENFERLNFNDLPNSLLYLGVMTLGGYANLAQQAMAAAKLTKTNSTQNS